MNKMTMNKNEKIRTVNIGNRGQLVIPEDIRRDLGIRGEATLVLIERSGEIMLKKESDVLRSLEEDDFWKKMSQEAIKRAWDKEDDIWDDIAKVSE